MVTSAGSLIPATSGPVGVMRYMGVQITTEDYFPVAHAGSRQDEHRRAIEVLSSNNNREDDASGSRRAGVDHCSARPDARVGRRIRTFLSQLGAQYVANFDNAMHQHEGRRSFLDRQLILAATRLVLSQPEPAEPRQKVPPHMAMVMLSHAIAAVNQIGR